LAERFFVEGAVLANINARKVKSEGVDQTKNWIQVGLNRAEGTDFLEPVG